MKDMLNRTILILTLLLITGSAALAEEADSVDFYLKQGAHAVSDFKWQQAIDAYENVIRLDPKNFGALKGLGMGHMTLANKKQANTYFKRAHRIYGRDLDINSYLGVMYSEMNNVVQAIDCFETALSLDSNKVASLNNLAGEYMRVKKVADALNLLYRAKEIEPDNQITSFHLGNCYAASGMYDSAEVYFELAEDQGYTGDELFYYLGVIKRDLGQADMAIELFKKAIRLNSKHIDCRQSLGLIYAARDEYAPAIAQFEQIVAQDPVNQRGLVSLGVSYYMVDRKADSDRILAKLNSINPALGDQMRLMIKKQTEK